jgi:hypothetical protein
VVGLETTDCYSYEANSIKAQELAAPFGVIKIKKYNHSIINVTAAMQLCSDHGGYNMG